MKQLSLIVFSCLLAGSIHAQSRAGLTGKPDTSFTLSSAYQGVLKTNPEAMVVSRLHSPEVKEEKNIVYCTVNTRKLLLDVFAPAKNKRKRPPDFRKS